MSAQDDARIIREGYEAFGKGDVAAVVALFADNITWHIPGRSPLAGDYVGTEGVLGFFGKLQERSGGSFQLDMHDLLASEDHVVALCTETAHRGDKSLSAAAVHVWHVRDGKATEFWGVASDAYAVDEFWA